MAAPMVSGAVALLLQDEPNLTPDQVKYRLMATANQSWAGYDPNKAGAGYLDIYAAVNGDNDLKCQYKYSTQYAAFNRFNSDYLGLCWLEFGGLEFGGLELGGLE